MKKLSFATATATPLQFLAPSAFAQGIGEHGMWWGPGWGYGHMMFGGLIMVVFWGGLIVLVVLAVRWFGSDAARREAPSRQTPLDILKERFARGEIDKKEFDERKKVLGD